MTEDQQYKYDIAFSFHSKDEALALQLNDKLQDRFKTFIYTEQQKILAGRDGLEVFSKVFGKEARLVVVFYRSEWGETNFTRMEFEAIKNRGFDSKHAFDFTFFVPTEPGVMMPEWISGTRLYYSMDRYGLDGAAGAIEAKVEELGAEPRIEGVVERAARLNRALKFEQQRKNFVESEQGVKAFKEQVERMFSLMITKAAEINSGDIYIDVKEVNQTKLAMGMGVVLHIYRRGGYANSLDGAFLVADYSNSAAGLPGFLPEFDQPTKYKSLKHSFDLGPNGEGNFKDDGGRFFSAEELADKLLTIFLDIADQVKKRR